MMNEKTSNYNYRLLVGQRFVGDYKYTDMAIGFNHFDIDISV